MRTQKGESRGIFLSIDIEDAMLQSAVEEIIPEVTFDISGVSTYSPAVMYLKNGDPGYPEESSDERTLEAVYISGVEVFRDNYPGLFELCERQMSEEDIEYEDDEYEGDA